MRAFTLSAHGQVSFKQDLQLMNVRGWQRVGVSCNNAECNSVVVQQGGLLRRDSWQPNLTISWTTSIGLSYLNPRFTDRAARVRVVRCFTS